MTISVPLEKLERLRDTLHEWSPDRVVASEEEFRSLIGRLLYLCEVVRPGKHFVRRMLHQVLEPTGVAVCFGNWRPAHPSVRCAVVSPRLFGRFPVVGRFWGVDRGG